VGRRTGRSHPGRPRRSPTTRARSAEVRERLNGGELHALVTTQRSRRRHPDGTRLGFGPTPILEHLESRLPRHFFAPIMMARGLINE